MTPVNVISFCLFGTDPIYSTGALKNADLIKSIYPGWQMRLYVDQSVPPSLVAALKTKGVDVHSGTGNLMLARFLVASDPAVGRFLVRDTDSRLNPREALAIGEWLSSGKSFHMIADHPHHPRPLHGGLWGGTAGKLDMPALLKIWQGNQQGGKRNDIYNNDQVFLSDMVWPLIKNDCLRHDFCTRHLYPNSTPLPAKLGDWRFVGEVFDANDNPRPGDWEMRINWMVP